MHNAEFDLKFINNELRMEGLAPISGRRVVDTLVLARGLFPGKDCRLAALARRLGVDVGAGALHRALADARLLAGVYAALRALGPPGEDPAASHA